MHKAKQNVEIYSPISAWTTVLRMRDESRSRSR